MLRRILQNSPLSITGRVFLLICGHQTLIFFFDHARVKIDGKNVINIAISRNSIKRIHMNKILISYIIF